MTGLAGPLLPELRARRASVSAYSACTTARAAARSFAMRAGVTCVSNGSGGSPPFAAPLAPAAAALPAAAPAGGNALRMRSSGSNAVDGSAFSMAYSAGNVDAGCRTVPPRITGEMRPAAAAGVPGAVPAPPPDPAEKDDLPGVWMLNPPLATEETEPVDDADEDRWSGSPAGGTGGAPDGDASAAALAAAAAASTRCAVAATSSNSSPA